MFDDVVRDVVNFFLHWSHSSTRLRHLAHRGCVLFTHRGGSGQGMSPELKTEWMKFKRSNAASACFVLKLDADNQTIVLDLSKTCSPEVMTTHRYHLNLCTSQCLKIS